MKALDDALSVPEISDQLRILESIPSKEYPALLREIEAHRDRLRQRYSEAGYGSDEYKSLRLELEPQESCLKLAKLVSHQSRKKLPKDLHVDDEILANEDVLGFMKRVSPIWITELIDKGLENLASTQIFDIAHRYVQAGVIPPPSQKSLYYAHLQRAVSRHAMGRLDFAKQYLSENRELVERDLHQSIRMQSELRVPSLVNLRRDPDGTNDTSLITAVSELCSEGHFHLDALIKTTLEAMLDSPREHEARELLLIHDEFSPTPEQSLGLQSDYFSLLASPHKAVVSFGIRRIGEFSSSRKFDADEFLLHVAPVFMLASNPLQIAILELVRNVAKDRPTVAGRVAPEVIAALMNSAVKVQSAFLDLLHSLPASARESISDALGPYDDRILPSLKPRFADWLKDSSRATVPDLTSVAAPKLETGERLVPVAAAEDLAFVANELLDADSDPMKFELFLDGLARFATNNQKVLAQKFKPLQKRVEHSKDGLEKNGDDCPNFLLLASRLIVIFGPAPLKMENSIMDFPISPGVPEWASIRKSWRYPGVMTFAVARIDEILKRVGSGHRTPLLATPEFELGFISPQALLDRFQSHLESGLEPGHFDFIQAIARCHLEGLVPESLKLPETSDEASRVLRFLFSGEIQGLIQTPAWWMAAARTREPFGDFTNSPQLGIYQCEKAPDWCEPAVYRDPPEQFYQWGHDRRSGILPPLDWQTTPDHLYSLQHDSVLSCSTGCREIDLRWRYSFTPGLLDAVLAQDIQYTHCDFEHSTKGAIKAASAVMAELARRRPPLRYTMQLHLLMALNSFARPEREAGMELLIEASRDGRLDGATSELGRVFAQLFRGGPKADSGVIRLSRLVPALREISNQGSLIKQQLRDILLRGLEPPPQSLPKGFPGLLELLLDLVIAHPPERSINLNTAWGGMLDGKSKSLAARIAKAGAS